MNCLNCNLNPIKENGLCSVCLNLISYTADILISDKFAELFESFMLKKKLEVQK